MILQPYFKVIGGRFRFAITQILTLQDVDFVAKSCWLETMFFE